MKEYLTSRITELQNGMDLLDREIVAAKRILSEKTNNRLFTGGALEEAKDALKRLSAETPPTPVTDGPTAT